MDKPILTLFTKNDCVYCDIMKRNLDSWGVTYTTVNISEDEECLEYIKAKGFRTVPQLILAGVSLNNGIDTRLFTKTMLDDKIKEVTGVSE